MRIYKNQIFVGNLPSTTKSEGTFGNRLVGINVSTNGEAVHVEPIYQPLWKVVGNTINFYFNKHILILTFVPKRPWVYFAICGEYQIEEA